MSIAARARLLGLTVGFSGSISSTGFSLSSYVNLAEFSLFGLGTLSASANFLVESSTDGSGTLGIGGALLFRKGTGSLARWLLQWMADEIGITGQFTLKKEAGQDLKVILDFSIEGMPDLAPSWAKRFCLEATSSSLSSSQECSGMAGDPNLLRPNGDPCEMHVECQSKFCQKTTNANEPDRCATAPPCQCPSSHPLCHNNEYCWKDNWGTNDYDYDPCGYGRYCGSAYVAPSPPPLPPALPACECPESHPTCVPILDWKLQPTEFTECVLMPPMSGGFPTGLPQQNRDACIHGSSTWCSSHYIAPPAPPALPPPPTCECPQSHPLCYRGEYCWKDNWSTNSYNTNPCGFGSFYCSQDFVAPPPSPPPPSPPVCVCPQSHPLCHRSGTEVYCWYNGWRNSINYEYGCAEGCTDSNSNCPNLDGCE